MAGKTSTPVQIREAIEELGFIPRQRNVFYELLDEEFEQRAVLANRQQAQQQSATQVYELT